MGRELWQRKDGQGLVEFAIAAPILLLLIIGLMEFGLILYDQHVITNASREGARYGIVARSPRHTVDSITAVVEAYCADHLITFGSGTPVTSVDPDPTTGSVFGDNLTVEVDYHYDFLVLPGFLASMIGGTNLKAYTTMKYE